MIIEVIFMEKVNRTAHCSKCGGVLLKIKPGTGYVVYYCADCNAEVSKVKYDNYETLLSTCDECGSNVFKARITVNENDSHEYWEPECIKCKGTPKSVFRDDDGNIISAEERVRLVQKDRIEELEEELDTKKKTINELNNDVVYLNYEMEKQNDRMNEIKSELENAYRHISELEEKRSELK